MNTILFATGLATLAMVSLIIGAWVGLKHPPSKKGTAAVLAFGTGALIQALALELAYGGIEHLKHEYNPYISWFIVAAGFIVGGLLYNKGNELIAKKGGGLRHHATTNSYLIDQKRRESEGKLSRLSQIDIIQSCPPEEMHGILHTIHTKEVKQGTTIFKEGDPGDILYLLINGEVELTTGFDTPSQKTLAVLKPGTSFGEMALLTGESRSATAAASKDSDLWTIERDDFLRLMDESPKLKDAVEKLNMERLAKNIGEGKSEEEKKKWERIAVQNIHRVTQTERQRLIQQCHEQPQTPTAIFLGAVMDGIPESLVIGASFVSLKTFDPTFLIAVFLANFPEAMASAITMNDAKFPHGRIYSLWGGLVVAGGISAALGNYFLNDASPIVLSAIEALAGGGILAMVTNVMIPEAYEEGGPIIGIATIAGFLSAFFFSL